MSTCRGESPTWLNNAYTEPHIRLVLRTLAERESRREYIRSISRSQTRKSSVSSANSSLGSLPTYGPVPPSHLSHYSVAIANQQENIPRNRYSDVVPYDRTCVIVGCDNAAGRYLNASWVLERHGRKLWIATQAPLPTTAHDFLSLIFQPLPRTGPPVGVLSQMEAPAASSCTSRIRTVVQLTKNVEGGRTKAHIYFPTEVGKSHIVHPDPELQGPALKVTLLYTQSYEAARCSQSIVAIEPVGLKNARGTTSIEMDGDRKEDWYRMDENNGKRVVFQHLMYTAWPDHGVPEDEDRSSLLIFLELTDKLNRDMSLCNYTPNPSPSHHQQDDVDPPILVGCSAGIGRTGTFIALSSLLRHGGFLLPAIAPTLAPVVPPSPLGSLPEKLTRDLVVEEIDSLREQRPRMVERTEQTLLIYELLIYAFNRQ